MTTLTTTGSPVRLDSVKKTYGRGESGVVALAGVSVEFPAGSFTAVMGPSGSGKSTLLHCAAGLDRPDEGSVTLVGVDLKGRNETQLTELRREHVAFVFQSFNLMPALNVEENITLPMLLAGKEPDRTWIAQVVERVGLSQRVGHRPGELSGGQQQRVAIARALAGRSAVTFADEPTGALDTTTALEVLGLLRELADAGQTIVMVTHDPVAASFADEVLFLVDGQIVTKMATPAVEMVAAELARLGAQAKQARGRQ
ncbi:ABC-type antimicrobial peptide transport system [Amycolatopsis camponoti]|uniref:ABC-type antimicrobial peptide transport system n=1 Tax=Amycolatopsis camponoti TaxID=2606593 RepID=A0A6I8LSL4_9PSEU|nr:ABC transporter ATP-binding protein [Amycolatopsis camponoti]VVJ19518.1 ABC-type antimicrobial peptide transport system [Amycolatopsis camponoti]